MAKFNEAGQQIPDQTPLEVPVGFGVPTDLTELIRTLVRVESNRQAEQGGETFEESDDFDVEEDDLHTPYQMKQMQEEAPREAKFLREEKTSDPPANVQPTPEDAKLQAEFAAFQEWRKKNSTPDPA